MSAGITWTSFSYFVWLYTSYINFFPHIVCPLDYFCFRNLLNSLLSFYMFSYLMRTALYVVEDNKVHGWSWRHNPDLWVCLVICEVYVLTWGGHKKLSVKLGLNSSLFKKLGVLCIRNEGSSSPVPSKTLQVFYPLFVWHVLLLEVCTGQVLVMWFSPNSCFL